MSQGYCGDGRLQLNETCDDGHRGSCSTNCDYVLPGHRCEGGSLFSPSKCYEHREMAATGFNCTDDVCVPICGDGMVVGSEICDPGSKLDCTNDCKSVTNGFSCTGGSSTVASTCNAIKKEEGNDVKAFLDPILAGAAVGVFFVTGILKQSIGPSTWLLVYAIQVMRLPSLFTVNQNGYT